MRTKIYTVWIIVIGLISCTIPKESRLLKKSTKDWRQSTIVLSAHADTPLYGIFLTLRENGKFEHTSSGLLKGFYAGAWTNSRDTIWLTYMDSKQNIIVKKKVIIEKKTSTMIFEEKEVATPIRLRIMLNKL